MSSSDLDFTLGKVQQTVKPLIDIRRRPLRVMSWNVERLGDTGSLGRNNGKRKDSVIASIAKIILKADPHVCALLEVFNGNDGKGVTEIRRILALLRETQKGWDCALSKPTGGFVEDSETSEQEGYALFFRADCGLAVADGKFIPIYKGATNYQQTAKGVSVYREPWEFPVRVSGKGPLAIESGRDWIMKVTAYHAPGPQEAPQRQEAIKTSILRLAQHYQQANDPVVFICADFNANEAATNILGDPGNIEFDTSSPVDLDFLARAYIAVKIVFLLDVWNKKYSNVFDAKALLDQIQSPQFTEGIAKYDHDYLGKLEDAAADGYDKFSRHDVKLKLTGAREATKNAKELMHPLVEKIVEFRAPEQDYKLEKEHYNAWRKLAGATSESAFVKALKVIAKFDPEAAEEILAATKDSLDAAKELAREFFEDEYEDLHEIYRSRGYATYLKKMKGQASQGWRDLVRELDHLEIEESYDGVFGAFHDAGFAVDTSYNSLQLTTRRKGVLNTSFAVPTGNSYTYKDQQDDDAVRCATYDQVMPRITDDFENPTLRVLPVFKAVLGPFVGLGTFQAPGPDRTGLFGDLDVRCIATDYTRPVDLQGMYVKLCATASKKYITASKEILKQKKVKTLPWKDRKNLIAAIWEQGMGSHPRCCEKNCVSGLDLNSLALMQSYLVSAKEISDHDPVLLGVMLKQKIALTF